MAAGNYVYTLLGMSFAEVSEKAIASPKERDGDQPGCPRPAD
jgi:hypothetical protein